MKKLRHIFCVCMAVTAIHTAPAQFYYNEHYYESDVIFDIGISPGIMNCFTDLGGKKGGSANSIKDLNWKNTKPCFSFYAAALYRYAFTAGLTATTGSIEAYDSILRTAIPGTSAWYRYLRNLSFRSNITEARLSIEVHPVYIFSWYKDGHAPRLSPYLSAGLGLFHFDPKAKYNGQWYDLHQLHTEGQDFPGSDKRLYSLNQMDIPVGVGVRYELSDFLNMHLELTYRILFTDYLDDVSTSYADPSLFFKYLSPDLANIADHLADRGRELDPSHVTSVGSKRGDPGNKDSFFSIQVKIGIVLGRVKR